MTNYNGFVSRAAFLECMRQQALEAAEDHEHRQEHPTAVYYRKRAARLLEQIQEAQRARAS